MMAIGSSTVTVTVPIQRTVQYLWIQEVAHTVALSSVDSRGGSQCSTLFQIRNTEWPS
ncbi:hypothetical protein LOK49_LG02G00976 [Camellia lanceoleosa]|uniref:Uncharacterized protein n=1 Tax=Camellia lanceoleosa TaxID=1840588 RepID=A0ACC0IPA0_9ERIC|nr:hypothetical protein LOK49_LG02G00976 [Camellia lanceoleosa]